MTVRIFIIGTLITVVLSWAIWWAIVMFLDPVQAGWIGFVLFFLSTFLAVASTAALVGFGVRRLLLPGQLPAYSVRPALRQGLWLGIFMDLLLFLQLLRLLRWWLTLIVIILFVSIEFVFLGYDRTTQKNRAVKPGSS
jgi:hypothetical protein